MHYNPIVDLEEVHHRSRPYRRKVATRIAEGPRYVTVRYHKTDIITIDKESRTVTLNSGGYHTVTTKRRMNEVMRDFMIPAYVRQHEYNWFVSVRGDAIVHYPRMGHNREVSSGSVVPFEDYMEITFV